MTEDGGASGVGCAAAAVAAAPDDDNVVILSFVSLVGLGCVGYMCHSLLRRRSSAWYIGGWLGIYLDACRGPATFKVSFPSPNPVG